MMNQVSILKSRIKGLHNAELQHAAAEATALRASQAAASLRSQLIKQRAHLASVEAQVTKLHPDSSASEIIVSVGTLVALHILPYKRQCCRVSLPLSRVGRV